MRPRSTPSPRRLPREPRDDEVTTGGGATNAAPARLAIHPFGGQFRAPSASDRRWSLQSTNNTLERCFASAAVYDRAGVRPRRWPHHRARLSARNWRRPPILAETDEKCVACVHLVSVDCLRHVAPPQRWGRHRQRGQSPSLCNLLVRSFSLSCQSINFTRRVSDDVAKA